MNMSQSREEEIIVDDVIPRFPKSSITVRLTELTMITNFWFPVSHIFILVSMF